MRLLESLAVAICIALPAAALAQPASSPTVAGTVADANFTRPVDALLRRVLGTEACRLPVKPCLDATPPTGGRRMKRSDFPAPAPLPAEPGVSWWLRNPNITLDGVRQDDEPCAGRMSHGEEQAIIFRDFQRLIPGLDEVLTRLRVVLEPLSGALPKGYRSVDAYVRSEFLKVTAGFQCLSGPQSAKVVKVVLQHVDPGRDVLGGIAIITEHRAAADLEFVRNKFVKQYMESYPEAKHVPDPTGPRLQFDTADEQAEIVFQLYDVQVLGGPKETKLAIRRSVLSRDLAAKLYRTAVDTAAKHWAERRQTQLGLTSFADVRDFHLANARQQVTANPAQALELLGPLFFFSVDVAEATKLRAQALAEIERREAAARAAAEKEERARQAASKQHAKEAARRAQARAAVWEGVDKTATLSAAVFDITRVRGRTVLWAGYAIKNLGDTLYLAASGGLLWAFRLPSKMQGAGIAAVKGLVVGTVDIDDGIRTLRIPLVAGAVVQIP